MGVFHFGITGGLMIAFAELATSSVALAQMSAKRKLDQIDRTFVCPENLPTDDARKDAVKLFLAQLASVQPSMTVRQVTDYRLQLLKKHQCVTTLKRMGLTPPVKSAPASDPRDRWERAGNISGPRGMVITVNMDSMVSAGPGKMRTWIKYRYNTVGPKNVKETLVYEQLDCARRYHSLISIYSYSPSGQIVFNGGGKPEDEEPIIPDSMLAGILPFTCAAHGLTAR